MKKALRIYENLTLVIRNNIVFLMPHFKYHYCNSLLKLRRISELL
jgi:hypothetical protein